MVKGKVIKSYKDLQKMLLFHPGEIHEVDEERADELVKSGVAKIVTKTKEAPQTETDKEEK